MSSKSTSY